MSALRRGGFSVQKRERVVIVAGRQTKISRPGFVPLEQPSTEGEKSKIKIVVDTPRSCVGRFDLSVL